MNTEKRSQQSNPNSGDEASRSFDVLVGGVREMAKRLNISERSAYTGVFTGQLPGQKIGGRWIVPMAAFNRFLDGNWTASSESISKEQLN